MRTITLLLALVAVADRASSQSVLFEEDFSAGLSAWSVTSHGAPEFHHVRDTNPCLGAVAPFPSGPDAAWFGDEGGCNFNQTGWPRSEMTLLQPVDLPAGAKDLRLSFWSYDDVECDTCGWDWRFVYVSDDGGATWTFLGESDRRFQWYQVSFDLTPWAGSSVLVRFTFDAVDASLNSGLGWLIDDVRIVEDACAAPQNYCVAATNSTGTGATMGWSGSTSVALDDFALTLQDAPAQQFAYFFYGPDQQQTPVADGFLCVGGGAVGYVRLLPAMRTDGNGGLSHQVDFQASLATAGWMTPGSTWNFQGWYRDPQGGPAGSNLTDGLRVTFCP